MCNAIFKIINLSLAQYMVFASINSVNGHLSCKGNFYRTEKCKWDTTSAAKKCK